MDKKTAKKFYKALGALLDNSFDESHGAPYRETVLELEAWLRERARNER